jgi:hypothetical protein
MSFLSFNVTVLTMSQVVEKCICAYKPYQLFSIHVITKRDLLSTRKIQRLTVCAVSYRIFTLPRQTRTGTSQTRPNSSGFYQSLSVVAVVTVTCRCRWMWTGPFKVTVTIFSCCVVKCESAFRPRGHRDRLYKYVTNCKRSDKSGYLNFGVFLIGWISTVFIGKEDLVSCGYKVRN